MQLSRLPLALTLVIAAAAVPGCSILGGGSAQDSGANLITAPNPPIADVPVPAGFSLVQKKSNSKVIPSSNVRFVDHLYSGREDFLPVVRFYRDQLPANGWQWVDQTQTGSEMSLHFTKNNEDCRITIRSGTLNTHIRIRIDPMGRNR
jgi:hypothetical protein